MDKLELLIKRHQDLLLDIEFEKLDDIDEYGRGEITKAQMEKRLLKHEENIAKEQIEISKLQQQLGKSSGSQVSKVIPNPIRSPKPIPNLNPQTYPNPIPQPNSPKKFIDASPVINCLSGLSVNDLYTIFKVATVNSGLTTSKNKKAILHKIEQFILENPNEIGKFRLVAQDLGFIDVVGCLSSMP